MLSLQACRNESLTVFEGKGSESALTSQVCLQRNRYPERSQQWIWNCRQLCRRPNLEKKGDSVFHSQWWETVFLGVLSERWPLYGPKFDPLVTRIRHLVHWEMNWCALKSQVLRVAKSKDELQQCPKDGRVKDVFTSCLPVNARGWYSFFFGQPSNSSQPMWCMSCTVQLALVDLSWGWD